MRLKVHAEKPSTKVLSRQKRNYHQNARRMADALVMNSKTRALVAKNVKLLRESRGMNQTAFALRTGIGQTTVSAIEKPEGKSPTLDTLEKIADAFDLPCWMLTVCDLTTIKPEALSGMRSVVESYLSLPPPGQHEVMRVAESEKRYAQVS